MSELSELYQEVILDHNKQPRNYKKLEGANRHAEGYNPLCGDQITVYLKMDGDKIDDVSFVGSGCAISKASSSMMTGAVKGKSKAEAEAIFEKFHQMVTGKPHGPAPEGLGKLAVFSGVCEFPSRVKCASLAWHTLRAAMEGKDETVSTEAEEAGDEQHNPHR
ncbi:MAG: SUF system NifU family Fe-S cluster assembly protein [Deltaproteobacteria bacterium]|nr:SUF system NifU family Fe-S cluster assembly protein [Deltaproteobacteria bacterium]